MSRVVHFEIPADDTGRAREFWSGLFGVEWQSYEGPQEYHMFGNDDQTGGGLMPRQYLRFGGGAYWVVFSVLAASTPSSAR
jgi:predicted enzyme related to lactoylglutathione lyase